MSDQSDGDQGIALGVVFGVIALVIALVIGISVYETSSDTKAGNTATVPADDYSEMAEIGVPLVKIYFAIGEATLPPGAAEELGKVTMAFQAKPGLTVLLSGFYDETGAAAVNAGIARSRAQSVREALVAAGIPAEHVLMKKPAVTLGGADAAEARRVEVRVQ